jgi:hypothetical protein
MIKVNPQITLWSYRNSRLDHKVALRAKAEVSLSWHRLFLQVYKTPCDSLSSCVSLTDT